MDTSSLLFFAGLGIFFFLMSSGSELPAVISEYLRQKHIEQVIAQLPESERAAFVRRHLDELQAQHAAQQAKQSH
jgi:DNA-directed RNA polymerase specialized sigma24 family protein